VFDEAGNVIDTRERVGDFKEPESVALLRLNFLPDRRELWLYLIRKLENHIFRPLLK
jgi:hypothetical protein